MRLATFAGRERVDGQREGGVRNGGGAERLEDVTSRGWHGSGRGRVERVRLVYVKYDAVTTADDT